MPIGSIAVPIVPKSTLYRVEDVEDKMFRGFQLGKVKGSTTYIPDFDKCWTWRLQEFNIWSGYMNEGKSLFLRYLSLIKGMMDGWKFLFCAPEDFPPEEFYDDMVHSLVGMSTDKERDNCMSEDWYIRAVQAIKDHFFFVYMRPGSTIEDTLKEFKVHMQAIPGVKVCIMDPLIKFSRPKDLSDRDDIYAAYVTALGTDFCRTTNTSLNLVMHQLTPRLTDSGLYPKPSPYAIKGGGTWADGVDNILTVWRPHYAKDKQDTEVIVSSVKIKKQKLVGIPQDYQIRFDRKANRYISYMGNHDLFNLDELFQRKGLNV